MRGDTILITGAAGFVGARLAEACNLRGENLISVDKLEFFTARPEHSGIDFGQRVERENLPDWLKTNRPKLSAIFHMGACTDTTELDVVYLRRVNLEYSQMLWNYCAKEQIPFYYASSAATYGDGAQGYSDDESRMADLRPLNPYGESKLQFDLWAIEEERRGAHPPLWAGFKFFNVYGFGERHKTKMSSVVLQAYDQISGSGRLRLFKSHRAGIADGHQKRDFIAVEDVVSVLHHSKDHRLTRGIYNLGTGEARTFWDLATATFKAMGREPQIDFIPTPENLRERYQYFTEADMKKLRAIGYTAPFGRLEEMVPLYVERLRR